MLNRKNIFLLGFMGSGKSTLGKRLAKWQDKPFVDLDVYIETEMMMNISDIFTRFGEKEFRKVESECLEKICKLDNQVISCGGGTPCYFQNMQMILDSGLSIYLKHSIGVLNNRISKNKAKRPLISKMSDIERYNFIKEKLIEREKYYNKSNYILENPNFNDLKKLLETIY